MDEQINDDLNENIQDGKQDDDNSLLLLDDFFRLEVMQGHNFSKNEVNREDFYLASSLF